MKSAQVFRAGFAIALVAGLTLLPTVRTLASEGHATSSVAHVWSEPANGYGFLDAAIGSARHSIDLSMYELSDVTLEHVLIARANAGVDVRVLLNAAYFGTEHNAASYALLRASKVHVAWAPTNQIFHAKYVVIDDQKAYLGTGNLESTDYSSTRDFWVEDVRGVDVGAMTRTFDGDFHHTDTTAQAGGLVWSPGSTSALEGLIDSAKHSLLVENEEMDSSGIESALKSAALRGVSVKVVMTESSDWTAALANLAQSHVNVRVLRSSQVYIHAKVICVDCVGGAGTVFIGSENFSTSSLSDNRELGVITSTPSAVRAVDRTVDGDFATGTSVVAPPPSVTGSGHGVTITAFESSISPGAEDSLSVHVAKTGETCDLSITLPSGYVSQSRGLGSVRANGAGNVTWTWEIGPNTGPGTARASISCTSGSIERNFQIS